MSGPDNAHIADCDQNNLPPSTSYNGTLCCTVKEICYDGKDNDGDGLVDCADPECNGADQGGSLDPFDPNTQKGQICHPGASCPQTLHEGLEGFWQFENTTMDSTTNGNDISTTTGTSFSNHIQGKLGLAMEFDPGDSATVPDDTSYYETLDPEDGITISTYIYPESNTGYIVDKGSAYSLYLSSGNLIFDFTTTTTNSKNLGSVPLNEWTHVAVTYNQSTSSVTGYIDGSSTSASASGVMTNSNDDLTIGTDGSTNFDGRIDQLRVYSRELTNTEIQSFTNTKCQNRQRTIECVNNPRLCETNYANASASNYHCNFGQYDDPQQQATGVCCPRDQYARFTLGSWGCYDRDACGLNTAIGEECAYNFSDSSQRNEWFNDTRQSSTDTQYCNENVPRFYDNSDQPSPNKTSACCYVEKHGREDFWFKDGNVKIYG